MRVVKQSTARNVMVYMVDSTDHVTPKTGLTLTVTASKDGAAFASVSPTVTERGNGWYSVALTSSHTDTLGDLALRATAAAADDAAVLLQVVAYDFGDATRLGLSALPNAAAEASGGLVTRGTGTGQISVSSGQVILQSGTGTGQLDFTSGVVKANVTQYGGTNGTFSGGRPEVNATHAAGTAWGSGAITAASIASAALNGKGDWNVGKTGYSLTQSFPSNFAAMVISAGGVVDADITAISRDSSAADNLETMLDGTGGATLSLGRLVVSSDGTAGATVSIASSGEGAALEVQNSVNGYALSVLSNNEAGFRVYSAGSTAVQFLAGAGGSGHAFSLQASGGGNAVLAQATGGNGHGLRLLGNGTGTGLSGNVTGNVTGNLSGSVGSVTGAVGSVTGAVGSVTGNVGGNVTGSVGSISGVTFPSGFSTLTVAAIQSGLSTLTAAQVNAECDTALADVGLTTTVTGRIDAAVSTRATAAALSVVGSDVLTNGTVLSLMAGSGFDTATDSLEAIRNRGDAAWVTATGFSTLDAAGVRTAVGLAAADLDTQLSAIKTDTGNLVTRVTSTLFAGITSLAQWLGLLAGKQAGDSTARTELRATGAGSGTYDETTDSLQALRDRGDAAWGSAGGGATAAQVWDYASRTLTGTGVVTVVAPVTATGSVTVVKGDDYLAADGRRLEWSSADWPDLTSAAVAVRLYESGRVGATADHTFAGAVVAAGGATQTVGVELTNAQTGGLSARRHSYEVVATLDGGSVVTLTQGTDWLVTN